jgi:hypothetical protein
MVSVRFKRYIGSRPGRIFSGLFECDRLSVFDLLVNIEAFADNVPNSAYYYTANEWTRTYQTHTFRRELQRPCHHSEVKVRGFAGSLQ